MDNWNNKELIREWIYYYGFSVGIALIIAPIAWDIVMFGGRGVLLWSVGCKGMALQIVGLVLMFMGGRDSR